MVFMGYTCNRPKSNANTYAHLIFLHKYLLDNIVLVTLDDVSIGIVEYNHEYQTVKTKQGLQFY